MVFEEWIQNIFFQAFIVGVICIIFRLSFQKQNPDKFFWVQIVLAAIAGSELMAIVFYFSFSTTVDWYMYIGFLIGGLAFPKLPDLIDYLLSGKPLTVEALWEHFVTKAQQEYNPLLIEILEYLKTHWDDLTPQELLQFLKQKEMQNIQGELLKYQKRLQKLQQQGA